MPIGRSVIKHIKNIFTRIEQVAFALANTMIIAMLVFVCLEIVARYFLGKPLRWTVELTEYSLLFTTFLSAGWILRKGKHVNIELAINFLSPEKRHIVTSVTFIIGAVAWFIVACFSAKATWIHFRQGIYFITPLRIPYAPIMAVIPFGCYILCFECLEQAWTCFQKWKMVKLGNGVV
jgi:C4-dicarboxylate transporter DctQ subunit